MLKNIDIEELITLNYEIEGLLYLALHRGSDTPDGVWHLIEEKVRCLNDAVITEQDSDASEVEPSTEQDSVTLGEPVCPDSELPVVTEVIEEEAETSVADDHAQSEDGDLAEHTVSDDDEPIAQAFESQEDATVSQPGELVSENEPVEDTAVPDFKEEREPVVDQSADDIIIDTDELVENSDIPLDDELEECLDETEEEPVIRLEEKLARDYSKNLRKAFSLNDKFRFRRELFSNSDTVMADTLNLVGAMSSYSEAEEYFYSDLQWDPEMPEVVDFMAIIKKHFS